MPDHWTNVDNEGATRCNSQGHRAGCSHQCTPSLQGIMLRGKRLAGLEGGRQKSELERKALRVIYFRMPTSS